MVAMSPRSESRIAEWENEGGATSRGASRSEPKKPDPGRNVMQTSTINKVIGATCLVVGLALGSFAGAWYEGRSSSKEVATMAAIAETRIRSTEADLSRMKARFDATQIYLRLGRIALEADRQDYGTAGERAARFFDDVALMAQSPNLGVDERADLAHFLAARDELIAGLATAQPSATERLKKLYLQLFDDTPVGLGLGDDSGSPTPREAAVGSAKR